LTPTLLLHLGAGYHATYFGVPAIDANGRAVYSEVKYDAEKELGLKGGLLHRFFPRIATIADPLLGGMKDIGGSAAGIPNGQQSPTFTASLTWVKITIHTRRDRNSGPTDINLWPRGMTAYTPLLQIKPVSRSKSPL
jgi:hypothetical protein